MEKVPLNNPHMWIPNHGPQPFDEICDLCGVFSGAHGGQPDPPEASRPCPEPWPGDNFTDEGLAALKAEAEAETQERADGKTYLYDQQRNCRTCGAPLKTIEVLHPHGAILSDFYLCPKGCPVYEAEARDKDGDAIGIEVMECADDAAAVALAEQWGRSLLCQVRLYKVPAINLTSCSSLDFWPDMQVIADIPAPASK
jgi:hypothetical protein